MQKISGFRDLKRGANCRSDYRHDLSFHNDIAKVVNVSYSVGKVSYSVAKMTNSVAKVSNSVAKVSYSVAKESYSVVKV